VIDACVAELTPLIGLAGACRAAGKSRATHYRRCQPAVLGPCRPRPTPPNALDPAETDLLLDELGSERFCDLAPAQVWATLLDEGRYLASVSTMYRVLPSVSVKRETPPASAI
jgi:putative transposase